MTDIPPESLGVDEAAALVAKAHRVMAQSAKVISELCLIAGCPERTAEFIAAGRTEAEERRVLIEACRPQMDTTVRSPRTGVPPAPIQSPRPWSPP